MRSLGVASYLLFLGRILLCEGDVGDLLKRYETLHSSDVITHHLRKRDVDLNSLYATERVVSFPSFGRVFRLRLFRQEGLFSDALFAAEVGENQTTEIYLNENEFYTGFIDGESRTLKTFAYWEDDLLVATIRTRNDTFFVEPSWRHLPESDNYSMIVYRLSDVKVPASQLTDDRVAYCSPPELNETLSSSGDGSSSSEYRYAANFTGRRGRVKRSNGDQQRGQRTVCSVMLVADYRFFNDVGRGSTTGTAKYMIGVMSRVNSIYTSTIFGPNFVDLGFEIEGVLVRSSQSSAENDYNTERTWDTSDLLNAFSSNNEWSKYCLVHLFTSTSFDNGVLGLAWVASDKPGSLGGICSPCSGDKCYNTGWSTSVNKFGNKLTTLEADLVTAHELGHGWGSQHDPDRSECSPSASENGKFIMYPFSVSGREPNNNKFSPCSQRSISAVLQVKKESCFAPPGNSYCGNYKVEEGEECDAGPSGRSGEDKCCDSQCQLRNGTAICSDSNADCCQDCTFAPSTKLCWTSSPDSNTYSSCRANSFCPGDSTVCPETALPDRTACANNGHCMSGTCLDICTYSNLISCSCDSVENSCVWCCKASANDSCQPMSRIDATYPLLPLADGYPCQQGYCQAGKCQQSISTTTNRLWDFIQHLTANRLLVFMRRNLVLATVILTLIPYIIFCIVICCVDHKKKQKAQIRQAWLDKNNDQLTLEKPSSIVKKIEGIHSRRFYGH